VAAAENARAEEQARATSRARRQFKVAATPGRPGAAFRFGGPGVRLSGAEGPHGRGGFPACRHQCAGGNQRQLERAQIEEGRAWVERARLNLTRSNYFAAAMMAGRAIGYVGYGRDRIATTPSQRAYLRS